MAVDVSTPRSRRAILAGTLGAVGAALANAFGPVTSAQASSGDNIHLGRVPSGTLDGSGENEAGGSTTIYSASGYGFRAMTNGTRAIDGTALPTGGTTYGVSGSSKAQFGSGVLGEATHASGTTYGVQGTASSTSGTGLRGSALAASGSTFGVSGEVKSDAGVGVDGKGTGGYGVRGFATTGRALYGSTSGLKSGVALEMLGKVKLRKAVGTAVVLAGTKSVVVNMGIDVSTTTVVVATLQGDAGGTTTVQRVAFDTAADTFTIYLTANAASNVAVGFHVFDA